MILTPVVVGDGGSIPTGVTIFLVVMNICGLLLAVWAFKKIKTLE